ncbi:MAG TPA: hypothetical protein P5533_09235 [Candidatus Cloacimonadota bacterium]|nr:hypothetical protein [Candidatus Cloacimonadota bacterium]
MTLKIDFKRTLNPLIVLVFSLLFLVSCAEKDSPELPDFSASNWESSYDAILRLDAGLGGQIELLTRTDPGTVDLSVNGSATQIQSTIFDPNTALYTTRIFSSQIADGVSLDYELDYAGGHSTGVFKVPWSLDPVFPSFGEGDYSFEWTTTAAPQLSLNRPLAQGPLQEHVVKQRSRHALLVCSSVRRACPTRKGPGDAP